MPSVPKTQCTAAATLTTHLHHPGSGYRNDLWVGENWLGKLLMEYRDAAAVAEEDMFPANDEEPEAPATPMLI